MSLALKTRLQARADSEHEQAAIRIVIVAVVLCYMGFNHYPTLFISGSDQPFLLLGLAADLLVAIGLFISIALWRSISPPRRLIGMFLDVIATTFVLFMTGEAGIVVIGVYLFITFGNGFRYGRKYLYLCQALCLTGFSLVLGFDDYWSSHRVAGWGLLVSLVVLPLYVSTLIKRIEEARARAEEASHAKTSFLANMSHEMRTPLNGIVGVTDLLRTGALNEQQHELVGLLRHSVSMLRTLVDDVLDITKIEAGQLSVETVDFDLHALINGLVGLLSPHAQGKGLKLRVKIDPEIDYQLRGDPHHLRQVLLNFIANAIKFTEEGYITVAVSLADVTPTNVSLRFEVRDTGIGMSSEVQGRIFERFVQADDSTTRRFGGTGLGTTIAKQLVELMGGKIGVESALGEGSTFWFELPLMAGIETASAFAGPEGEPAVAILLAEGATAQALQPIVIEAIGVVKTLPTARDVVAHVQQMQQRGVQVQAVLVSGDQNTALEVFRAVALGGNWPTAMIYLTPPSQQDADVRVQSVEGVTCLSMGTSSRLLRNAVHAVTTRASPEREGAEIIDLARVLEQKRQLLRILVADDNTTNQIIIRQLLERVGHTVIIAADGEQALDLYEETRPDLAVLDFNMPQRNGLEVCTAIRTMEAVGTRLPVIVLSASVTPEARERAQRAGADEFVGKPYEAGKLLQAIDRLARRASRNAPRVAIAKQSPAQLIDSVRLGQLERMGTDPAFLATLLHAFSDDVLTLLRRLDEAVTGGDLTAVSNLAHAMQGAALGIGAAQFAQRCAQLGQAATGTDGPTLQARVSEIRSCFEATTREIAEYTQRERRVSL